MSKSYYYQWEQYKEGLGKMTWTLGNFMKQNNNHIYRVITVRQFVLDSDIAIYKPRVIPCSSVDRLVFPVRSEIFLQIPSSVGVNV